MKPRMVDDDDGDALEVGFPASFGDNDYTIHSYLEDIVEFEDDDWASEQLDRRAELASSADVPETDDELYELLDKRMEDFDISQLGAPYECSTWKEFRDAQLSAMPVTVRLMGLRYYLGDESPHDILGAAAFRILQQCCNKEIRFHQVMQYLQRMHAAGEIRIGPRTHRLNSQHKVDWSGIIVGN